MKIENEKIVQYINALGECSSVTGFPGMMIATACRKMSMEITEYVQEKKRIFEKYGEKREDGWEIQENNPNFEKAMEEIMQIATYQTDVDIPQFSETEFIKKFQSDTLTAKNYGILYEIFVKKEDAYVTAESQTQCGDATHTA